VRVTRVDEEVEDRLLRPSTAISSLFQLQVYTFCFVRFSPGTLQHRAVLEFGLAACGAAAARARPQNCARDSECPNLLGCDSAAYYICEQHRLSHLGLMGCGACDGPPSNACSTLLVCSRLTSATVPTPVRLSAGSTPQGGDSAAPAKKEVAAVRYNTLRESPEGAKYKLCVVQFKVPGAKNGGSDKGPDGNRIDSIPIANGVIEAGGAC
jgi:hypothetical protein